MLKYVYISLRKDTLLLEANNLVKGNNDALLFCGHQFSLENQVGG